MRAPRYYSRPNYGFNMTPMIDVVFQLIIFFLVSSHLARNESQIDLRLPVARSAADDTDLTTPRVTINIKDDGSLWINARPVAVNRLTDLLSELVANEGENLEVRIRGSRSAAYSHAEPVMWACTQSGIWNVSYAVYREEVR